jgi:hypothetical protein
MMMTEDSRAVPLLKNPRHEKFALALAEGKSATDAYALAGYKPCRQNAHRMTTKDDIQARLAEIQGAAAKASEVTIESLLSELEAARAKSHRPRSTVSRRARHRGQGEGQRLADSTHGDRQPQRVRPLQD